VTDGSRNLSNSTSNNRNNLLVQLTRTPWSCEIKQSVKLPVDSVVDEKLRYYSGNNSDADSQTKPTTRSVEQPPQPDRHRCQCQRQLQVVGKVNFLHTSVKGINKGWTVLLAIQQHMKCKNYMAVVTYLQFYLQVCFYKLFFWLSLRHGRSSQHLLSSCLLLWLWTLT